MPLPPPVQRELINRLARFRAEQARGDAAVISQLSASYSKIYQRLQEQLELELRRIYDKPESVVTRAYIRERLERLTEQVRDELEKYQAILASTIDLSTDQALLQGSKHAVELMRLATLGTRTLASIDFGSLNPAQVNTMIGFLAPDSPLYRNVDRLARFHAPIVRDQLVEAVALGYNPYKAAGNIAPYLRDVTNKLRIVMARPFADAVRLARTSMLYSYREAARMNYQANGDVVSAWQWYAELDGACVSCIAMHGTIHPLDEVLNDHHHGRCAAVPVVLGQPLIPETAGVDYFDGLNEAQQREILGAGAFDAWKSGSVELSQFSHEVENDTYGLMRSVTPLKDLIGSEG